MEVFRISTKKYAADLSGKGAADFGGRWNLIGTPVLYTAGSRALAILEKLAHLDNDTVTQNYQVAVLEIPETLISELPAQQIFDLTLLMKSLHEVEACRLLCLKLGQSWLANQTSLALKVPSALVPEEFNFLINPMHPDFSALKLTRVNDFIFDSRLFKAN